MKVCTIAFLFEKINKQRKVKIILAGIYFNQNRMFEFYITKMGQNKLYARNALRVDAREED